MRFDLASVGFSTAGATLVVRLTHPPKDRAEGLHLQMVPSRDVLQLTVLRKDKPVDWDYLASPAGLVLKPRRGTGSVEFVFETPGTLRIRVVGVQLRMEMPTEAWGQLLSRGQDRWQINHFGPREQILLSRISGDIVIDAPWDGVRSCPVRMTVAGEVALETYTSTVPCERTWPSFARCRQRMGQDFATFLARLPEVPPRYRATRAQAGYILWSAQVGPAGRYHRPAVLMSKNRMSAVWSWDHCFNALALMSGHPDLAWDQMLVVFDHQDRHGALPDTVGIDSIGWNFCKPPIHGWAFRHLLAARPGGIGRSRLAAVYPLLAAWTRWWLRTRDDDGDGVCQYHHGNDSGWDNATCFAVDMPVEGPDLAAFLVLQMEVLADLARRLGRGVEARNWARRSERMLRDLVRHFWRGDRFVATQSGTHRTPQRGDSLIPFVPLILGRRLPSQITRILLDGLFQPGRFLTPHGLATESPRSPLYEPDGYWRGPIWAPSTYLIYDGLRQLGEHQRSQDLARRFCDLCRSGGMAENFDALTGRPLRDRAYTWTASVFLLLARDLLP